MKKITLIAFVMIGLSDGSFAQTILKEKKKTIHENTELIYTVSDKNQKSGSVYITDLKTNKVFMKGTNSADKPSGKWYFYNDSGNLESYYNYDLKKLLYIDSAYLKKIQVTIKSQDKEAINSASIPILLYPSALFVKQIAKDIHIPAADFGTKTEIPLSIIAVVKANGQVDYFASYISGNKKINLPIVPSDKELESIFIPAHYKGKPLESVFTMNTILSNDGNGSGHRRFTWNY